VVTAHRADDHVGTVAIRILRDAGARGLAAMYAPSPILRPLIDISRADVAVYAANAKVRWVEDPSNAGLRYLRNRVRHELLPACERVHPGFGEALLGLSRRAASWRDALSKAVDSLIGARVETAAGPTAAETAGETGVVPANSLTGLTPAAAAIVWPELAGRVGVALDWRGVERLGRRNRGHGTPQSEGLSARRPPG